MDTSDIINAPSQLSEETTRNCKCFAEQSVDKVNIIYILFFYFCNSI